MDIQETFDELFSALWGMNYSLIKDAARDPSPQNKHKFESYGITIYPDYIEIYDSRLEKLTNIAKSRGIHIGRANKENLARKYSEGKHLLTIEGLPLKLAGQFVMVKIESEGLFKISAKHKEYLQHIFDFFQNKGYWPSVREVVSELEIKVDSINKILELFPNDSMIIKEFLEDMRIEAYRLTILAILHLDESKTYYDEIANIAKSL